MPLIARQRSRLAVLAVLALVGSLLAVSAVPVAADDGKAAHPATYSACVGDATEDAGFTDMEGSYAADAANCLAHYGITQGTTTTTYSPSKPVTRTQMALFLARAAGPAGIDLGTPEDQGLTDLDGTSDEARNAINQVVKEGIMDAPGNEFAGVTHVTREEMAVHLDQFLSHGFVGNAKDIDPGHKYTDIKGHKDLDTILTDLGTVTYSAYGAIQRLYDLGVTEGNTKTTYNPTGLVSRAQMAAFITRTLAHTNARPAGLTVQANTLDIFTDGPVTFKASVRNDNHQPVADAFVDYFYLVDGPNKEALDDDGKCTNDLEGGVGRCEITGSDEATNADGNVTIEISDVDTNYEVWFWTGDLGTAFDADDIDPVSLDITVSPDAHATQVTVTHRGDDNMAKYGEEVTLTIQLVDADGDPVAQADRELTLTTAVEVKHADDVTDSSTVVKTHKTDANGQFSDTFTYDDPNPGSDKKEDRTTLTITLEATAPVGEYEDAKGNDLGDDDDDTTNVDIVVHWDDDDPEPTSLSLSSRTKYVKATDAGSGAATAITATLTDQYGDGIRGKSISFSSSMDPEPEDTDQNMEGIQSPFKAPDIRRTTGSGGVATLRYSRDSKDAATETFSVADYLYKKGECLDTNTDPACDEEDDVTIEPTSDGLTFYWATAPSGDSERGVSGTDVSGTIKVVDADASIVVVTLTSGSPRYIEYDADDAYTVTEDGETKAVTLADFEKGLAKVGGPDDDSLAWNFSGEDTKGVGVATFTLTLN